MLKKYTKKWYKIRSVYHILRNLLTGLNKKEPIVVLTIGKVGSSSIYHTLKDSTPYQCFHVHCLSKNGIERQIQFHNKYDKGKIPPNIRVAQVFQNKLLNHSQNIYYIVIVRSPIDRLLSAIFQHYDKFNIKHFTSTHEENYIKAIELIESKITEKGVQNEFDIWIKEEIQETLGIDIFSQPYNEEKGYNIYKKENKNLLLMKMERLNTDFTSALKIFLNTEQEIILDQHNVGNEKEYREEYRLVKNNLKIEEAVVENFTKTKYFQHFYTGQEEELIKKWSK